MMSAPLTGVGSSPFIWQPSNQQPLYSGSITRLEQVTFLRYKQRLSRLLDQWLVYADSEGIFGGAA